MGELFLLIELVRKFFIMQKTKILESNYLKLIQIRLIFLLHQLIKNDNINNNL
jgi:hypothetical protein